MADSEETGSQQDSTADSAGNNESRRGFVSILAAGIGALLGLFPVATGVFTFLNPLLGKRKGGDKSIRVATLDSIPATGVPVRVPIVADLVDAWNREPNQPVGAIYLRRASDGSGVDKVVALNAICPHAGCSVGFDENRDVFQCPCHTSSFQLDGEIIHPSPSPRGMDPLTVDEDKLKATGEVWVEFVNYYPGKAERTAKE